MCYGTLILILKVIDKRSKISFFHFLVPLSYLLKQLLGTVYPLHGCSQRVVKRWICQCLHIHRKNSWGGRNMDFFSFRKDFKSLSPTNKQQFLQHLKQALKSIYSYNALITTLIQFTKWIWGEFRLSERNNKNMNNVLLL